MEDLGDSGRWDSETSLQLQRLNRFKAIEIRRKINRLRTKKQLIPIAGCVALAPVYLYRNDAFLAGHPHSFQMSAVLIGAIVVGLIASVDSQIRDLLADENILGIKRRIGRELPSNRTNTENTYFSSLVRINVANLEAYYALIKIQTDKSFRASLTVAYFGAGMIIIGLGIGFFRTDATAKITYISTGAGVLTEFIAGVFFWLYSRTVSQLRSYHDSLISVQNILLSFKLVSDTEDPKERSLMVSQMCSFLLSTERRSTSTQTNDDKSPKSEPPKAPTTNPI